LYWEDNSNVGSDLQILKSQLYSWVLDDEIKEQEIEAERILRGIWHCFLPVFEGKVDLDKFKKFVPAQMIRELSKLPRIIVPEVEEDQRYRLLCDFISGMTDRYALNVWEQTQTCSPTRHLKSA
jgi:dGTP triphosphohydrolase